MGENDVVVVISAVVGSAVLFVYRDKVPSRTHCAAVGLYITGVGGLAEF